MSPRQQHIAMQAQHQECDQPGFTLGCHAATCGQPQPLHSSNTGKQGRHAACGVIANFSALGSGDSRKHHRLKPATGSIVTELKDLYQVFQDIPLWIILLMDATFIHGSLMCQLQALAPCLNNKVNINCIGLFHVPGY